MELGPRFRPDGTPDLASITAAVAAEQIAWIRAAAGQRMAHLELNILLQRVVVTGDREREAGTLASQWGLAREDVLDSPYLLIGTSDQMVATLRARRDRYGISYVSVFEDAADAFAPVVRALTEKKVLYEHRTKQRTESYGRLDISIGGTYNQRSHDTTMRNARCGGHRAARSIPGTLPPPTLDGGMRLQRAAELQKGIAPHGHGRAGRHDRLS